MAQSQNNVELQDFRWKNRVLVVFAPNASIPALKNVQESVDRMSAEFEDRNLVLIELVDNDIARINGEDHHENMNKQFRDKFRVAVDSFRIYLIGKDGGIKLKSDGQVELDEIFALIDTMPMRKREMEGKDKQ